jgi:hypothetical protein
MSAGPVRKKAEVLRDRRIGDTHNDLRFAASRLSGVLVDRQLGGFFHVHLERQAVLDLEQTHHPVADAVEVRKELDGLGLELEVRESGLETRSIVPAELDFVDGGGRFEHRLAVLEAEVFDAAEVDGLEAKQKLPPGRGERRF